MGLDTEFISERTYHPQLALLQVATRDGIYLIDPLAEHAPGLDQPIWEAMVDPGVCTVVHAHDQESQFCLQRTGQPPADLFDVQLAAAFSGYHYPIAYDRLVARELHRSVGASQSRTNWLQRPLTNAQRQYAANDVRWLLRLHQRFVRRMTDDSGSRRLEWLAAETAAQLDRLSERQTGRWRRLPGANRLSPRSRAALRALTHWREQAAQHRNVPLRRIVADELLVAIAASRPSSLSDLQSVRGIDQLRRADRPAMLDVVSAVAELPEDQLPPRATQPKADKPARMLMLFLESVLAAACAIHEIEPSLVANNRQLRALLEWNARGRPSGAAPDWLDSWRGEVCGEALLRALDGEIILRIHDPSAEHPLTVAGLPQASG